MVPLAEVLWFGLLYPFVPRTLGAACLEALIPLPVAAYVFVVIRALFWLSNQKWKPILQRAVGMALASSVGVVAFGLICAAEVLRKGEFGYWWPG
jgi:hypothetical protein